MLFQQLSSKFRSIALIGVIISSTEVSAGDSASPLHITSPSAWIIKYHKEGTVDQYAVTSKANGSSLLMFSRTIIGKKVEIPKMVDALAKHFVERAKSNPQLKLKTFDFKVEQYESALPGAFVKFELETEYVQTLFIFSDGTDVWTGQFTGPSASWSEALMILKNLKQKPLTESKP